MTDNRDNDVPMLLCLGALLILGALLPGCSGIYREAAYDPGPPGAGHWRPAPPTDELAVERCIDVLAANGPKIVTVEGKLSHHGMVDTGGMMGSGPAMGDEHTHCDFRLLPSGRVATPCFAADLWWTDRSCVVDGRWLILEDRCQVYDESTDTVIWGVARSRRAR